MAWSAWYSGVVLAISGNLLIAASLILQKRVHLLVAASSPPLRAEQHPLFPIALIGLVVGEVGNFAAFGLASPTVVSPLGAVAVIANAAMSSLLLREPFLIRDVIGLLLTVAGAIVVVAEAPSAELKLTVDSFASLVFSPTGAAFFGVTLTAICVLLVLEPRRVAGLSAADGAEGGGETWGERYLGVNIVLCALLGSITVLCSAAEASFTGLLLSGQYDILLEPLPYLLLPPLVLSAVLQLRHLNKAMAAHNANQARERLHPLLDLTPNPCPTTGGAHILHRVHPLIDLRLGHRPA